MSINIQSNAKINLGLKIEHKRKDEYHNISTLMQEINLYDEIIISHSNSKKIILDLKGIPTPNNDSNLCYIAAKHFLDTYKIKSGVHINLNKIIPIGAGLGGGSSNAASIIKGLAKLFDITITNKSITSMVSNMGADIPFFIKGGLQLVEGMGDNLTPISPIPIKDLQFLLVIPPFYISTPWAYKVLNKTLQPDKSQPKFLPLSEPMKWELFDNDFERVIHETYPEIGQIKASLINTGALYAGLSGSGSTVFGVFDNFQKAETILGKFSQYQTFLTSPVFR